MLCTFFFCQTCISIAYPQSELRVFKVIKSDVQIRPGFADPITYKTKVM